MLLFCRNRYTYQWCTYRKSKQNAGHKNLRTTQHYTKILDWEVSDDMKMLKTKHSTQNKLAILKKNIHYCV